MHIREIAIRNFRVLSDSRMDLDKKPCLMIGRNNAGKTSFMVLFEKFLRGQKFDYNDFPIKLREKLLNINTDTDENELAFLSDGCMIQWEQENLNVKVILKFFEKITVGGKAYAPVGSVFTDRRT